MNKPERIIVDAAVSALQDLGIDARARHGTDTVVTVRRQGRTLRYLAEIKRRVTPSLVGPISIVLSRSDDRRLLVTDHVTPPVGDALRLSGVPFVDTAGNVFLDDDGVFIFVTGRAPKKSIAKPKTLRLFRRSGLQVLFALLSEPDLVSAPQRTIAKAANVSLGSVPAVLDALRELGGLVRIDGRRRIVDRERWIDQWTESYLRTLAPALEIGRFSARSPDWWRLADPAAYRVQWGGETAAAILRRSLRPEQTIVYADVLPTRLLAEQKLKADPAGDVRIRARFWNAVPSPRPEVVPALLIYADLLANGDARSLAEARFIRKTFLD